MLETIITKIGVPVLVQILTEVLTKIDAPAARGASEALKQVDSAIKSGEITTQQMAEAHRHAEAIAGLELGAQKALLEALHQTARTEIASSDPYVRRMRPTFGYMMALTWAAQMLGLAYVIVFDTEKAGVVLAAMSSLSAIWAMGLSVLGIYVYKRSEEKRAAANESIFWNQVK